MPVLRTLCDRAGREPFAGVLDRADVAEQHHHAQRARRRTAVKTLSGTLYPAVATDGSTRAGGGGNQLSTMSIRRASTVVPRSSASSRSAPSAMSMSEACTAIVGLTRPTPRVHGGAHSANRSSSSCATARRWSRTNRPKSVISRTTIGGPAVIPGVATPV